MPSLKVKCAGCGEAFLAKSPRAKWCGPTCRQRDTRAKQRGAVKATSAARKAAARRPKAKKSGFEIATEAELRRLGKLTSMLGQQALVYARRMSREDEPASAIAALGREHSRIMGLLGAAVPEDDEVTTARKAREAKLRKAGLSG